MLSVHEVESGYGLVPVLHGVSLEVAPGEIVAVLGPPNGQASPRCCAPSPGC